MSDYTPSTEDVRDTWESSLMEGIASDESKADADWDTERMAAQFDRWLAEHDRQVRAAALGEALAFIRYRAFSDDRDEFADHFGIERED